MRITDTINDEYFEWLFDLMCADRYDDISYRKLLMFLHNTDFRWSISKDENRADDGIGLRRRFCLVNDYDEFFKDYISGPCSVLEMMVALAIRCEEGIMDNTEYGDRTQQWFWGMITSLGLGDMYDSNFSKISADRKIQKFLDRDYQPNGKGGLFTIRNCDRDIREVELWIQLCWYLDSIGG